MRTAEISRKTAETALTVRLDLDGTGRHDNATGVGFFDHMLDQLARHALIDLEVRATGDLHIDDHHTVEDVGIALGRALAQALGDKRGIRRYGACLLPMDDALVRAALDLSGRPYLVWKVELPGGEDRQLRHRAGPRVLHRARHERRHDAARRAPRRRQQPPHRRGQLQGGRPRAPRRRSSPTPHGRRRALHQGHAHRMTTAIIDYASGNLHSAEKSFQRMAAETGRGGPIVVTADPDGGARGRPHRAARRRRLRRLPRRPRRHPRPLRGHRAPGDRRGRAVPRHLRRPAADGEPRPRARPDPRLRLDPRRRRAHRARRPCAQGAAHGLERARGPRPAPAPRRHRRRRPRLLRALLPSGARGPAPPPRHRPTTAPR